MKHFWKVVSIGILNMALAVGLVSCGSGGGGGTTTLLPGNNAPVANAGPSQSVMIGSLVTLDGSGSTDAEGNAMIYNWSFTMKPDGSIATLSAPTSASPQFTADLDGSYVVRLVVSDKMGAGFADSVRRTPQGAPGYRPAWVHQPCGGETG